MSGQRITRNQAKNNIELQNEVEALDPYKRPGSSADASLDRTEEAESFSSINLEDTLVEVLSSTVKEATEGFENLVINPVIAVPQVNMAAQTIPLKDSLKVVPEFNGKNIPLSEFFEGCDEAHEMIDAASEANFVKLLRSKLTGEATLVEFPVLKMVRKIINR